MNSDEPNTDVPKRDRHWNHLYWAYITSFVLFTVLTAWEVYAYSSPFNRHSDVIKPVAAKSLPAPSLKKSPSPEAQPNAHGSSIVIMQSPPVTANTLGHDSWSGGDVVSAMSSFYTAIITILIALIGIMGVLAGFTLRALSRSAAEETAHEQANIAMTHYISSRKFARDVAAAVEEAAISTDMEKLAEDVDKIRRLLRQRPNAGGQAGDEDVDGNVEPQAPGPEEL